MQRTDEAGNPTENPEEFVELDLEDGVVLDASFVERTGPPETTVTERLDPYDDFQSVATEVWEYTVAPGRENDFRSAVANTRLAIDIEEVDSGDEIIGWSPAVG